MDDKTYQAYVKARAEKSPLGADMTKAFVSGGAVCVVGQALGDLYRFLGADKEDAACYVSATLIVAAALLTVCGVFDKLAKWAGAGTLVPITGFANSVVSPALDTKAEGLILGVGAKIFLVAGPVILYGTAASALYGLILWAFGGRA